MAGHVGMYSRTRLLFLDATTEKSATLEDGCLSDCLSTAVMLGGTMTERAARRLAVRQFREYLAGKDFGRITDVNFSVED